MLLGDRRVLTFGNTLQKFPPIFPTVFSPSQLHLLLLFVHLLVLLLNLFLLSLLIRCCPWGDILLLPVVGSISPYPFTRSSTSVGNNESSNGEPARRASASSPTGSSSFFPFLSSCSSCSSPLRCRRSPRKALRPPFPVSSGHDDDLENLGEGGVESSFPPPLTSSCSSLLPRKTSVTPGGATAAEKQNVVAAVPIRGAPLSGEASLDVVGVDGRGWRLSGGKLFCLPLFSPSPCDPPGLPP